MITHPCVELLSQHFSRTDLFTVVYCLVDTWMHKQYGSSNMPRPGRGPRPDEFSDSEVLTVLLVAEICHCHREHAWLRQVRGSYLFLFPALPEESRFSRRAQRVRHLLTAFRKAILFWADADLEEIRIVDSFPMPLCACYRAQQSTMPISGTSFGYNASKKQYFLGLHPLASLTASLFVEDIILAPGYWHDRRLAAAYLDQCQETGKDISNQDWVGDKGFYSVPLATLAHELQGVHLLARKRDYDKDLPPAYWQQILDRVRKPIEDVLSILTRCFGIENILARSDWGIFRRTEAKATAFCLARYFNLVLQLEPLEIARYAV